jgi:hypothetical protein
MPEYRIINLDLLVLDSHNPRLPKSKHGSSEQEILKYMLIDSSLIELMLQKIPIRLLKGIDVYLL